MGGLIARRATMQPQKEKGYIVFEDPAVEAICIQRCSSDGIGVTYEDAAGVTSIDGWFYNNNDITKFNEFQYFTNVGRLNYNALSACTNLVELTFPNSEKIYCNERRALAGSTSIKSRVYHIPSLDWWWRFYYRSSSFPYYNSGSFTFTLKVNGEIPTTFTLPAGVTEVPDRGDGGLLAYTDQFTNFNMPGLTRIGNNMFSHARFVPELPNTIEYIGGGALDSAKLPSGYTRGSVSFPNLKSINGNGAFGNCTLFNKILDLGQITDIPTRCFVGIGDVTEIHLPSTLLTISNADRAIQINRSGSVYCHAVTPPTFPGGYQSNTISCGHIYVPAQSVDAYKEADGWSQWASIIEAIPE